MMRPGELPSREAIEQLFENLFLTRGDLPTVGRMKFNRLVMKSNKVRARYLLMML